MLIRKYAFSIAIRTPKKTFKCWSSFILISIISDNVFLLLSLVYTLHY